MTVIDQLNKEIAKLEWGLSSTGNATVRADLRKEIDAKLEQYDDEVNRLIANDREMDKFLPPARLEPLAMLKRGSVLNAGPLKVATYQVRDPETMEFGPHQYHMTFGNTVMAVMGEESAKCFANFVNSHQAAVRT